MHTVQGVVSLTLLKPIRSEENGFKISTTALGKRHSKSCAIIVQCHLNVTGKTKITTVLFTTGPHLEQNVDLNELDHNVGHR